MRLENRRRTRDAARECVDYPTLTPPQAPFDPWPRLHDDEADDAELDITKSDYDKEKLHEWRGPALRLVFHLLVDGELASLPVRELAELTDTAPGTVVNVFDSLERMGVLVRTGPRTRRFVPDDRVIDRWIIEYERKLWPRTLIGRFLADRTFERASCNVADRPAVWGAEAAAERLGASLRPEVRTLYVAGETKAILRRARLHPAADGDLELRTMFWHRALPAPHEDVAPVLLIVADLLATGDGRCAEAAQELRREHLARSLES